MCLIVAKPKGKKMPKGKKLKQWFNAYPDGVGIAFQYRDKVRILKGALTIKQMFELIDRMRLLLQETRIEDIDIVIQFRQAVTGSVCPRFCHPFPISPSQEDLDALDVLTEVALAHNGVIYEYSSFDRAYIYEGYSNVYVQPKLSDRDVNDAQEFIKDYLVGLGESLWNPSVQALIRTYTMSKFALLSSKGITYIGKFEKDNGYLYSNDGYKQHKPIKANIYIGEDFGQPTIPVDIPSEGGAWCSACGNSCSSLYSLAEDEDSQLCRDCFIYFVGRPPIADDKLDGEV